MDEFRLNVAQKKFYAHTDCKKLEGTLMHVYICEYICMSNCAWACMFGWKYGCIGVIHLWCEHEEGGRSGSGRHLRTWRGYDTIQYNFIYWQD